MNFHLRVLHQTSVKNTLHSGPEQEIQYPVIY